MKRGLRNGYVSDSGNSVALRGKINISSQIRHNLLRRDRFYTEYDEFKVDRPENRVVHSALHLVLSITKLNENQRLARELVFAFSEVPRSDDYKNDFRRIRLERSTQYYTNSLDWARLILDGLSPLSGIGLHESPSLLFPMDALFEAHVEKKLRRKLASGSQLRRQSKKHYLVEHKQQRWFNLKPDLVIESGNKPTVVLDTKWKLLDGEKGTSLDKYNLSQSDFYQLYAYGHHYLEGAGDVVLIYPRTDKFDEPLPVFNFPQNPGMRLWVIPFCLDSERLLLPDDDNLNKFFR